jgi:hypothetical protein
VAAGWSDDVAADVDLAAEKAREWMPALDDRRRGCRVVFRRWQSQTVALDWQCFRAAMARSILETGFRGSRGGRVWLQSGTDGGGGRARF